MLTAKNPLIANLPLTALAGVGSGVADKFAQLGVTRLFELVLHLPREYEDRSRVIPIDMVTDGMSCLVVGVVTAVDSSRGLSVTLTDKTGSLTLKFFKTYSALLETMSIGATISAFGEVKVNRFGVQMAHPDYYVTGTKPLEAALLPVYPAVKGLHQNKIRQVIRLALHTLAQQGMFCVPDELLRQLGAGALIDGGTITQNSLLSALYALHMPDVNSDIFVQTALLTELKERTHPACQRLILEELVAHQLSFMFRRNNLYRHKAPRCQAHSPLAERLIDSLPFMLTGAQTRVVSEIVADLVQSRPMLRLVQGDVGAGKTLVAALASCHALDGGWQVAVMAPTEILAEQHFINFKKWFEPLGVDVGWLVGKQSAKERNQQLARILNNQVQIVVGTHALFQEGVGFAKLGLAIIDEQHRFGVEQRLRLANKGVQGSTPHQLAMTATPIPRTLAMSMYGDMDISVIDELPPKRTPITTVLVSRERRDEVLERVAVNCQEGKQAYWVCPLVEESTALDAQSAELMYEEICAHLDIPAGLVHGKMKAADKQAVMQSFKEGKIALLVAATVIEVGVDVPNASLMVIENAERLGLSQLHQLRGRVGRGSEKSYCVLLYQTPLSLTGSERLTVLKNSTDGFVIAQKDLELRGAGELLGKRQTGDMGYYISDIVRDEALLVCAKKIATTLIEVGETQLSERIMNLWIANAQDYVNA